MAHDDYIGTLVAMFGGGSRRPPRGRPVIRPRAVGRAGRVTRPGARAQGAWVPSRGRAAPATRAEAAGKRRSARG